MEILRTPIYWYFLAFFEWYVLQTQIQFNARQPNPHFGKISI